MVKDIISVDKSMDLVEVANIMLENGIGSVPVQDDDMMIGIVSKADFVSLCVSKPYEKITVGEVMTKNVISVSMDDRLIHARRVIIDNKIGRLLVTADANNELVGIITSKDIIRVLLDFKKHTPEKYQKSQIKNLFVDDIMSENVSAVSSEDTIADVANQMMETGFNGYPVINDNNEVIGIITQTDLLALCADIE